MNRIRIGQSFQLRWKVSVNRQQVDLSTLPLHLELVNPFGRASALPFRVENDVIVVNYAGTEQSMLGTYRLTLYAYKGAGEQSLLDACDAFTLVSCTCDSDMTTSDNLQVEQTIELTGNLNVGIRGRSAYEVWLDNGHEGTEADFVAWLQGPKGDKLTFADLTKEDVEQLQRPAKEAAVLANTAASNADKAASAANTAAAGIDGKIGDIRDTIEGMKTEGNALASDVSAGKKLVADAITKKGVPTKPTDSYAVMAENVGKIYKGAYDEFLELVIDNTFPSDEVQRIGSSYIPDWMEENADGAILKDGKINYYLDYNNFLKKSNGMPSVIDGSDGDILVRWPQFWYTYLVDSYSKVHMRISNIPQTSDGWYCSPEMWVSPHGMVFEQRDGKNYARSCYNVSPEFRGGDNNAKFDNLPGSRLGMQRTAVSHEAMRMACRNKGSFDTGDYHGYCPALYIKANIMFMCIYGTRNWQADPAGIDPLTGKDKRNSDGFKYGGLGRGVSDCGSWWPKYNGNNPFIPTNACLEYGCRSGVYDYNLNIGTVEEPSVITLKIPNFLGCLNTYGYIFTAIDGMTKTCYNKDGVIMERYGLFFDPKKFVSAGTDGADVVIDRPATNSGWIKEVDQYMLPTAVGGSESKHYCDYLWMSNSGNFSVWNGGNASFGGVCGGWCVGSNNGVGYAYSGYGGRLCFTPS